MHAEQLQRLSALYTLVWATTWTSDANRLLSPLLGLPDLPYVDWPQRLLDRHPRQGRNGSWKTPYLAAWLDKHAPSRPWVWLDDEPNRYDRAWFTQHYLTRPAPPAWQVVRVDAHIGLVADHFDQLTHWAHTLPTPDTDANTGAADGVGEGGAS